MFLFFCVHSVCVFKGMSVWLVILYLCVFVYVGVSASVFVGRLACLFFLCIRMYAFDLLFVSVCLCIQKYGLCSCICPFVLVCFGVSVRFVCFVCLSSYFNVYVSHFTMFRTSPKVGVVKVTLNNVKVDPT